MTEPFDDRLRCEVTENLCGTDTWEVGHPCQCECCQEYLRVRSLNECSYNSIGRGMLIIRGSETWKPVPPLGSKDI